VVPVPGPSAPIAALAASGLPTDRFVYLGFLPRRSTERRKLFASLQAEPGSLVAFESPHRLVAALGDALDQLGDRRVVVARELTKVHEEFIRGSLSEVANHFRANVPRGEVTLVLEGGVPAATEVDLDSRVAALAAVGGSLVEAAAKLAGETGLRRREAYRLLLGVRNCAKI
jgi:16S rRNA (cytidine1402-2'-O)-methyltransferase